MLFLRGRAMATLLGIVLALAIMQFWSYDNLPVVQAASNTHQQTQIPNCYPCYSFYGSYWTTLTKFWGQGYNTNNGSDPEPNTPNHYYVPPFPNYPHHWDTYFVTIEQDRIPNNTYSYDYAIDENGHLAPHN